MKRRFVCPTAFSRLLFGFVVALAIHLVGLSYLHLQGSRQFPLEILHSNDNTAELLEFSSEASSTKTFDSELIPKALALPPPRSISSKPRLSSRQIARRKAGTLLRPSKQKPTLVRTRGSRYVSRPNSGSPHPTQSTLSQPSQAERVMDWGGALRYLRAFQAEEERLSELTASDARETFATAKQDGESPPILQKLDGSQQAAYQSLWQNARPLLSQPWSKEIPENKGPTVEVRHFSLDRPLPSGIQVGHRQIVVLGDQMLLVWLDGKRSWLLRSMRKAPSSI